MPNPNRGGGKSTHYRSAAHALSRAPARVLLPALPNIKLAPVTRQNLLAWRPKIFAFIVLAILFASLYEFFASEWFFVEHVDVQGFSILTSRDIERATRTQGYNVFFVEPSQMERALVKIPEVKTAQVILGVPNSLLVQIEERVPETVWFKGEEAYWVDAEGIAFKARSPRPDLPTVRDLDPTGLQPGRRVSPAPFSALRAVKNAWQQSPKNFEWAPANGLSAIDEHGWKIIFGDASDMELKIMKLKAILARVSAQGTRIKFIDLGKGEPFYQ